MSQMSPAQDAIEQALNVASVVGVFKWIVVGVIALGGIVAVFNSGGMLMLFASAAGALLAWVVFGLVQHTLGMLALIATNTARP